MVINAKVMVLPLMLALLPKMSFTEFGWSGLAPDGNELAGKALSSLSSYMMRVAAAYASCNALLVATYVHARELLAASSVAKVLPVYAASSNATLERLPLPSKNKQTYFDCSLF